MIRVVVMRPRWNYGKVLRQPIGLYRDLWSCIRHPGRFDVVEWIGGSFTLLFIGMTAVAALFGG